MSGRDQRIHGRVKTEIPCTLWTQSGEQPGLLVDLSHGGALVQAAHGALKVGEAFEMEIERSTSPEPIAVMAEVLRINTSPIELEEQVTYATRFSLIEPKQQQELLDMVEQLSPSSSGQRLTRRVEMQCGAPEEFRALMKNLAAGNIGLQCATALVLSERVTIALRIMPGHDPVLLKGTVAHVRSVDENVYHVGIRFDPLSKEHKDALAFYERMVIGG